MLHLKTLEKFFIQNYYFYRTHRNRGRKDGIVVAVGKGIPHSHIDLPPFVSIEATRECIQIGKSGVLFAAVYKSPVHAWRYADIIELFSFRHKSLLSGDLNANPLFCNGVVSNPSCAKLLNS
jgi:hypothetical protein